MKQAKVQNEGKESGSDAETPMQEDPQPPQLSAC